MCSLEFWSKDSSFGFRLDREHLTRILSYCQESEHTETGGIIVGCYTEARDCAVVTEVTGPPDDSRSGPTWFMRGIRGLQSYLNKLWRTKRHYYLGEWHFHPDARPTPSPVDKQQMRKIANSISSQSPEPILLIIGGDPAAQYRVAVYVFPRGKRRLELLQLPTHE